MLLDSFRAETCYSSSVARLPGEVRISGWWQGGWRGSSNSGYRPSYLAISQSAVFAGDVLCQYLFRLRHDKLLMEQTTLFQSSVNSRLFSLSRDNLETTDSSTSTKSPSQFESKTMSQTKAYKDSKSIRAKASTQSSTRSPSKTTRYCLTLLFIHSKPIRANSSSTRPGQDPRTRSFPSGKT